MASNNNIPIYLKHELIGDIVSESYLEFVITPEAVGYNSETIPTAGTYTLKSNTNNYSYNKAILSTAFGSDRVQEYYTGTYYAYIILDQYGSNRLEINSSWNESVGSVIGACKRVGGVGALCCYIKDEINGSYCTNN